MESGMMRATLVTLVMVVAELRGRQGRGREGVARVHPCPPGGLADSPLFRRLRRLDLFAGRRGRCQFHSYCGGHAPAHTRRAETPLVRIHCAPTSPGGCMKVAELMRPNLKTIDSDATVGDAVAALAESQLPPCRSSIGTGAPWE